MEAKVLVAVVNSTEGMPCSRLNASVVVGPASGRLAALPRGSQVEVAEL